MLIVSEFHDYYDTALGQGIDKTIVYNREVKEFFDTTLLLDYNIENGDLFQNNRSGLKVRKTTWHIIGFCGRTYVCLRVETSSKSSTYLDQKEFYFGLECLKYLREDRDLKKTYDFITKIHGKENIELFFKYKSPVFIYTPEIQSMIWNNKTTKIILNPILKEYKFFKIFDTFTAFQEIAMFISGVLGSNREPELKLTDKDKIIQHGFDTKWSFRNPEPPKRKQKN